MIVIPATIQHYVASLERALASLSREPLAEAFDLIGRVRRDGGTVFVFGNGGSASTASHMACDLAKNTRLPTAPRLRVMALVDGPATLSAYANDEGYDTVFAEPLRTYARPGDVALAISGSGSSRNVVRALEAARELGLHAIGLTGPSGGCVADLVDICVRAHADSIEQVEDIHLIVNHILTVLLRDKYATHG